MPEKSKKPKKTTKKSTTPPPLDIGLPKSGLISGKKAMDIVPKGKTLPSSSAKPIIVSNRAIVKDPMAPPELTDAPTEELRPKRKVGSKVVIEPLHSDVKPEDADIKAQPDTAPEVSKDPENFSLEQAQPEEAPAPMVDAAVDSVENKDKPEEPKDEPKKAEASKPEPALSETDEAAEEIKKSTEPKPEDIEREKAEKRAEEAKQLIASKKYFLPINAVKKRRSTRATWLLLILLLVIIVILGLLDAGILTFTKAPTDFIAN